MVFRIFVEKKTPHDAEAKNLLKELKYHFDFAWLNDLRILNRYDVENIREEDFEKAKLTIFSESASDAILEEMPKSGDKIIFAAESLPGQYDQRADVCAQCLQLLAKEIRPTVRCAKIYIFETVDAGKIPQIEIGKVKKYIINPVECREAALEPYCTLHREYEIPTTVETLGGFIALGKEELAEYAKTHSFAMDMDDLSFCQNYFRNTEMRDPTITEMRMIDAYWSDHCRHTTFLTEITDAEIADPMVETAFKEYLDMRSEVYGKKSKKSVSLMDLATIGAKFQKIRGKLTQLDESEEVNACSVNIKVNIEGKFEDYLLMFKNETHNHPTEIEPFGGAATALGGDIRDVMAGRAFAYQGMRITGAADPRKKFDETMPNKLPQFKITKTAANGFSSYGNQFGAATAMVCEIYHENYAAKRMELGAVIGAVPKETVKRMKPVPGDAIILLGGKTGRDGCGGATSSSHSQSTESLKTGGAEVQKGDPLEERKILRFFKKPQVAQMIKRCNDFGAGGVSVAIGELSDSIFIDLSLVPAKYPGLDGTELAISESQERMAVVVAEKNAQEFIYEAKEENLEATKVATVTNDNRLRMVWNGNQILSLDRGFLNSNGAKKQTKVKVFEKNPEKIKNILGIMHQKIQNEDFRQAYADLLSDLNVCSQKGLSEQFDFSVGAGTVISPFGGRHRLSPAQVMVGKIPAYSGITDTCSVMAHGFSPYISEISPYLGAMYAVVESVSKLVAAGVDLSDITLSFQEYFPRADTPEKFGLPFESLLGALVAQNALEIASIGGKDSMSGSFSYENEMGENMNIDVPPTLVSFAVGVSSAEKIISNEFKGTSSYVYLLKPYYEENGAIDLGDLKNLYGYLNKLTKENMILSSYAVGFGGIGEAIFKMCAGNGIGFSASGDMSQKELFSSYYGAFIVESTAALPHGQMIGKTKSSTDIMINGINMELNDLTYKWILPLEEVFPTGLNDINEDASLPVLQIECQKRPFVMAQNQPNLIYSGSNYINQILPTVLIPVFPGTTGEYDVERQIEEAGGFSDVFVFCNKTPNDISESLEILSQKIASSQMLILPGGFSGGDEPGGSGKFISAVFRDSRVAEALRYLLFKKEGLLLGLGNGFQALVKLGLLPYGDIKENLEDGDLTVTSNKTGRHRSYIAYTRVASVKSPWFAGVKVGDIHALPFSHGEGRIFCNNEEKIDTLIQNGQIAAQYCDFGGNATMHPYFNPSASSYAIEGIFALDGRIFGKMGHNERNGRNILKNVPGNKSQMLFTSGIKYFR
ncbi:MAG: phosphoribosylformylglycinamidine synthase [Oscillospiraceae bacterium]|nr:phosphoribosylformylglycinamidine synthase [Oscillospiraceae bacterium]